MGAQAAGADVALVTDAPPDASRGRLHLRELERLTPLRLIRALDAEIQLRGSRRAGARGPRERRLARLFPPDLRAPTRVDPEHRPGRGGAPGAGGHAMSLDGRDIVCLGFGEWDAELWTNQQHLMSRLAGATGCCSWSRSGCASRAWPAATCAGWRAARDARSPGRGRSTGCTCCRRS